MKTSPSIPPNSKMILDKVKLRQFYCMKIEEENHKKFYRKIRLIQNKHNNASKDEQLSISNDMSSLNKAIISSEQEQSPVSYSQSECETMKLKWKDKVNDIDTDFLLQSNDIEQLLNMLPHVNSSLNRNEIGNDYHIRKDNYYNNQRLKEILDDDDKTSKKSIANNANNSMNISIDYDNRINVSYEIKNDINMTNNSDIGSSSHRKGNLMNSNKNSTERKKKLRHVMLNKSFQLEHKEETIIGGEEVKKKEIKEDDINTSSEISVKEYNTDSIIDTSDSCNELFV